MTDFIGFGPNRRRSWIVSRCAVAIILVLGPALGSAQESEPLDLTPACTSCVLEVEPLLSLSMEDEDVGPVLNVQAVALDARGEVWIAYGNQAPIQRFDQTGGPVNTPRRVGEGPGEFVSPTALVPIGDSMAVFDQVLARVTILDHGFDVVRTLRIPSGTVRNVAIVEWPLVVVNALFSSPMEAGHAYHLLDLESGEVRASFGGGADGNFSDMTRFRLRGHVAVDPERREIWTVAREEVRLERWSFDGERIETFVAAPSWFPGIDRAPRLGSPAVPPDPRITGLQLNADGLWLILRVPAEDWQAAWAGSAEEPEGPHGRSATELPEMDRLYQGRLLLIDPDAGEVLATRELEASATGGPLVGGAGFYGFTNTAGLFPGLRIDGYRLSFREPRR